MNKGIHQTAQFLTLPQPAALLATLTAFITYLQYTFVMRNPMRMMACCCC